jgi:hypothetical protein
MRRKPLTKTRNRGILWVRKQAAKRSRTHGQRVFIARHIFRRLTGGAQGQHTTGNRWLCECLAATLSIACQAFKDWSNQMPPSNKTPRSMRIIPAKPAGPDLTDYLLASFRKLSDEQQSQFTQYLLQEVVRMTRTVQVPCLN